ncbi:monofunctional biosynthetic peptidoglycan transglycosylase [Rhodobacteraceae bacterium NNCM2]|nr:monofunctional biosynthetic peptidoglycan transglycosylase [Coraliihabitans acroporae]
MARQQARKGTTSKGKQARSGAPKRRSPIRRLFLRVAKYIVYALGAVMLLVLLFRVVNPPIDYYMLTERLRLGKIEYRWADLDDISRHMPLAAMAAEDANFCGHPGFDFEAIEAALDANNNGKRLRGGSTISQQVAKNLFLWPERSWLRKGLEAGFTGLIELLWPKRRIIEVYLNIAEFGEGVFGVSAAAKHYFGKSAADLSEREAARLAAILPAPKTRSASRPGSFTQRRARSIVSGMRTLAADGRAGCL